MRVAVFGAQAFERPFFDAANEAHGHDLLFLEPTLCARTASLAQGCAAVCAFVNDRLNRRTISALHALGVRLIALRCAGFNHVDLEVAEELDVVVARVPAYSPHAVAEHTVALMLALNRRIHRSVARVREQNFSLNGLLGFDLHGKTAGIIGTGKIGALVARILSGFGCRLLGFDVHPNPDCESLGMQYVDMAEMARQADVLTLHCPLNPQTHRLIDRALLEQVKPGVMLINTSRGGLIDTQAVIDGLKSGRVGLLGLDVYEEEADLFFRDLSDQVIHDDVFARLLAFPNVIVTAHQAFLTREALSDIACVTLQNVTDFESGVVRRDNLVTTERHRP